MEVSRNVEKDHLEKKFPQSGMATDLPSPENMDKTKTCKMVIYLIPEEQIRPAAQPNVQLVSYCNHFLGTSPVVLPGR